jgi:hypothetical protein
LRGHIGHVEDMEYAYAILFINPEEKKPVWKPRHREEGNSIMIVKSYL